MNDSLFGSLISDVIYHRYNASISFYTNLPKFYCAALESPDPSKVLIEIIQFITQWCQISDGFATRILVDNLQYLLPPDDDQDQNENKSNNVTFENYDIILQTFSKLLKVIIEELGSFISPQLQQFVTVFRPKLKDTLFDEFVFPTLFGILELDAQLSDSVATAIRFISKFLDILSKPNIQRLLEKVQLFSDSPQMHIRLAIIDTFPSFCTYEPSLFETVFLKFFNDQDTCVKSHFISVIASNFSSKINILIPFATDANWKLRYSYIENCSQFIATDKEIEDIFYQISHYDPEIVLRSEALHRLATCEDLKIEVKIEKAIEEEKDEIYKPDPETNDQTKPRAETEAEAEPDNSSQNQNESEIKIYDSVSNPNGSKINFFSQQFQDETIIPVIDESHEALNDDNERVTQSDQLQTQIQGLQIPDTQIKNNNSQANESESYIIDENGKKVNSQGNIIVHSSNEEGVEEESSSSSSSSSDDQVLEFGVHTSPVKPSTTFSSISPLDSSGSSPFASRSILTMAPDSSYLTVFKNDEKLMNLCHSNKYVRLCINSLCSKYKHLRMSGCELACKLQVTAICFRRAIFKCARTQREIEIIMKGYIPYCRWNEGTKGEQCVLSIVRESLRNPDWRTALSALTCISLFITDKVKMKRRRRTSLLRALKSEALNQAANATTTENTTATSTSENPANNENATTENTKDSTPENNAGTSTVPSMNGTTVPSMSGTTVPSMNGTTVPSMSGTTAASNLNNEAAPRSGFSVESACIRYGNAFLALKLFGEVLLRIESPNFCVRQEAVEQIFNFVKCFGWDFYLERVHQKVIGFTKSNRIRTQRISARILRKMLKLNPPDEIKEKIVAALELFDKLFED